MQLPLLLAIVVLGISGIAALLHVLGKSRRYRFTDPAQVREMWRRQYPDIRLQTIDIADTGHQVLVTTAGGPGLIWAMGADVTSRLVGKDCKLTDTGNGLRIRLDDYTAPQVRVVLQDTDKRQHWAAALTGA